MFDWINDNILEPAKDVVSSLTKEIGRGISSVTKEIGRITDKIGVVGAMALTTILPAVADKVIKGTLSALQVVAKPVFDVAKGLFDYTTRVVTNGKNFISNISEGIFNTAKNFTKTLGKKLGLDIEDASNTFFQGSDSAWARSTGKATVNLENIVSAAGGEKALEKVVQETVRDASNTINEDITSVISESKNIESNVEVKPINIDGKIDLVNAEDIANFNTELTVEKPEIPEIPTFEDIMANNQFIKDFKLSGDSTGDSIYSNFDSDTLKDFSLAIDDSLRQIGSEFSTGTLEENYLNSLQKQPSLLERAKDFGKEMLVDTGKAALDTVKEAPAEYIDQSARAYVTKEVQEKMYGTPEEQFQEELRQAEEMTDATTRYSSAPMLQFGTQTEGAPQYATPTAFTYTAPISNTNAAWGYNAYTANVYGDRLRQFQ